MKILDLVLMHKWYDMIESGQKDVEYRKAIPHWIKRLLIRYDTSQKKFIEIDNLTAQAYADVPDSISTELLLGELIFKDYDAVRFRRGYTKTSMLFEISGMYFGYGMYPHAGAPRNETVFNIVLGKKL